MERGAFGSYNFQYIVLNAAPCFRVHLADEYRSTVIDCHCDCSNNTCCSQAPPDRKMRKRVEPLCSALLGKHKIDYRHTSAPWRDDRSRWLSSSTATSFRSARPPEHSPNCGSREAASRTCGRAWELQHPHSHRRAMSLPTLPLQFFPLAKRAHYAWDNHEPLNVA
jgi:hypothetical protein